MVPDLQPQQNIFQRRRQLARAEQQRSGLLIEGIDDLRAIGKRKPVVKRDVRTRFHFGNVDDAHTVLVQSERATRTPVALTREWQRKCRAQRLYCKPHIQRRLCTSPYAAARGANAPSHRETVTCNTATALQRLPPRRTKQRPIPWSHVAGAPGRPTTCLASGFSMRARAHCRTRT